MLASTSKMPAVSLLMALHDDESLDYDVETTIDTYLPWDGVYGDRTTVDLVSNTSGIPGLAALGDYGPHVCQFTSFLLELLHMFGGRTTCASFEEAAAVQ